MEKELVKRRRYRTRLKYFKRWPELTALLDVLCLLLLFFALAGSFIRIPGIGVELPRIAAPEVAELERFVVSVTPPAKEGAECQFYFKDKVVTFDELKHEFSTIKDKSVKRTVIICADSKVPFDTVAQVLAAAEAAELSSFIAVMPPEIRGGVVIEKQ
ncbi:MAG: biopolymer transporter ExbD [Lentisphaeria bacterium]|nr:biopolymer transporter ExbD [Lentisphaeria bacterium]